MRALLAQNLDADESLFDSMSAAFASASVLTFAAPELAVSPLDPTPAGDQYALGAVCYFALTGLPRTRTRHSRSNSARSGTARRHRSRS
ncbi:hypothetical protein J8F10_22550 [Gemmata sp. G18]|uniref:Protein kinase domain-containing protein n=1 Tax=Gemmata palustris TaxID=2822762 RepID=A0ABS5BWI4_9BACT|nr:hypothetical protein [Gemmata palustris]MBP3958046.1 hypothetical protein [Gemmata palustris]